jgi:hypothetical protein
MECDYETNYGTTRMLEWKELKEADLGQTFDPGFPR